jgi:hypothetical protein
MSFVSITREFLMLVKGDLDEYTTQKSTIKVNNFLSLSLFTPAHLQFAKYGRGPGKMPPLDPLIEWVSKKGIVSGGPSQARGAAFAIAKSISKKGTKNYVPNAPNALEEALNKHMNTYVTKVNEKHVNDTIKKLDKSYDENLKRFTITL